MTSIEERLKEVLKAGVPYVVKSGNSLEKASKVVRLFGKIPEVILSNSQPFNPFANADEYAEALCSVAYPLGKDVFIDKDEKWNQPMLKQSQVEYHAIYDSDTNMTHHFITPLGGLEF
ncbi:hypothetical protein KAT24_00955 [Candidatus Pacearchaeota archaeon]|nr:hypothetical protein [Candidatus Pacearchaeota archaeon]